MVLAAPGVGERGAQPAVQLQPATAQVGKYFIFSSSTGLARDLIKELKAERPRTEPTPSETAVLEADGPELARLLELNRCRLAMQLMLEPGRDQGKSREPGRARPGAVALPRPRPARHSR